MERFPIPALTHVVRTVWVQDVGDEPYAQRHLPTGGVELHWPLGGRPYLLGPLTGPLLEMIPARTVVVGVRFHPGAATMTTADLADLVDRRVRVDDLGLPWSGGRVGEAMHSAPTPDAALQVLQAFLHARLPARRSDPLVDHVVRRLMPWGSTGVATVADEVGLSTSQLRRRCLRALGTGPKVLQRTLRFQGFLALAQRNALADAGWDGDGVAGLAVGSGYADQAHLSREVRRLSGLTPTDLLGGDVDRCLCGHDHAASYTPFLAGRGAGAGVRDPFKTRDGRPS